MSAVGRTVTRRSLFVCGCSARSRAATTSTLARACSTDVSPREPRLDEQPSLAAPIEPRRAGRRRDDLVDAGRLDLFGEAHRHPDFRREHRHHAGERIVEDADDRELLAANAERASDRRRFAAELAPPIPVRQHHRARRVGRVVFGEERAAEAGGDAERREVVAGDDFAEHQPRAVAAADPGEHRRVAGHVSEHVLLLAVVEDVGQRIGRVGVAVGAARIEVDQPGRLPDRRAAAAAARRRPRRWRCCSRSRRRATGWRRRRTRASEEPPQA